MKIKKFLKKKVKNKNILLVLSFILVLGVVTFIMHRPEQILTMEILPSIKLPAISIS